MKYNWTNSLKELQSHLSAKSLLGAIFLGWILIGQAIEIQEKQERARNEAILNPGACEEDFVLPWRHGDLKTNTDLMSALTDFKAPGCASVEFRPSKCRADVFLVQCWSEEKRTGLFRAYEVDLQHPDEIISVWPDFT